MASESGVMAIALLLFTTFTQGDFGILDRSYSFNATAGQQVTLPCLRARDSKITQIEWRKQEGYEEHKIVVYNPRFGPQIYYRNSSRMTPLYSEEELVGSTLELQEVDERHSGTYVCELTTFPAGTVKVEIHLQVTDLDVSVRVQQPNRAIREGDHVTIQCGSIPPADSYSLWPSKNRSSNLKATGGTFTLTNVTRNDSGIYICQPGNSSVGLSFQGHNASVGVTVNYLDEVECNSHRSVVVIAGQDISVTCSAKASQEPVYIWRKLNMTVSLTGSLHLRLVSREDTGVYVLTTVVNDTGLQRQWEFNLTVQTDNGDLPTRMASPISTVTSDDVHELTVRSTAVSTTTEQNTASGVTFLMAMTEKSVAQEHSDSTLAPRTIPATPFEYNSTDIRSVSTHGQPTVMTNGGEGETSTTQVSNFSLGVPPDVGVTKTEPGGSTWYVALIVLFSLVLLLVIFFLYRRYSVKRRMNMPPPFKPPPPPVKYTSVKTQDSSVTIQQELSEEDLHGDRK